MYFLSILAVLAFCCHSFVRCSEDCSPTALIDPAYIKYDMHFRDVVYCEILSSRNRLGWDQFTHFTTYNTLLNGCPMDQWEGVTEKLMNSIDGSLVTKLNGPRAWAFDTFANYSKIYDRTITDVNGLQMFTVAIIKTTWREVLWFGLLKAVSNYQTRRAERRTTYIFLKGRSVSYLKTAEGRTFVMQSYLLKEFPNMRELLPTLASKMQTLPAGWSYHHVPALKLDLPLKAINDEGVIMNDEFFNMYSECDPVLLKRAIVGADENCITQ